MVKVLQLTKHYPPVFGGIETVTFDITKGLNKRGCQCDVLCVNTKNALEISRFAGYTVTRVPRLSKIMSTSIAPRLPFYLAETMHNYNILHVHFPDPMAALALYIKKPRVPIVVHWHSDIIKQKRLLTLYKPIQDWVLKNAACIITTSNNYATHSAALQHFLEKVSVVPIGISPENLENSSAGWVNIKARHKDKKIIFALGRLVYYKGFEYLVRAAATLDDNAVVLIGGEGPLKKELEKLIEELRLQHKVFLLGNVPSEELGGYFKACDIFCLPAIEKSEAFGVVLLEAMYFGKPVVTSNIVESGICWVNQHGETGYNVPPKNTLELASAINELLRSKEQYEAFSKNAAERFRNNFTGEKMIDRVMNIYDGVTKNNID